MSGMPEYLSQRKGGEFFLFRKQDGSSETW